MDINIDALYKIIKKNQRDVNDAMGSKKKTVVVTSDPLGLIAEKTNVSRSKEKAFNRRKFYSKPTNNNLRTSSSSQSTSKKQEFVKTVTKKVEKKDDEKKRDMSLVKCYNCKKEGNFAKDCKKSKVKDYEYYKTKMLLAKKDKDEQVLLDEDQAWMESNSDLDQEINANMVFMAQIKKFLSNSEASSSSANEKISEVSYYLSESESESEFETSEYYDNSTNYGLFVNNDDEQENFHDAIESPSKNFIENHIDSQKDYDKSDVDHNDSEEKYHLVDKLIRKCNKKIVKCQNRVEKANQQSKDFKNQNKDLQDKYDYATMMRQNKNLMDINIDALYNILKQNQGDVNDAMGLKKKTVVITSDPLALITEKTNARRSKENVVVSSNSEGSEADDFSELKKIIALLAKAFNRRKFYSMPTNNNLRTSSTSQSANKKQEFVKSDDKQVMKKADEKKRDVSIVKCYNCKKEGHFAKNCKKAKVKDYEYYKTKMLLAKKDKDEQALLAKDQAWMESSSDSDQEINANIVFMAQIKKVLFDFEASSSSADEKISEVSYYLSESESESEFETLEYYDNSTDYGLFVNNDDDQEIIYDAIDSASESFIKNHIDSQKDYDKSDVDHNDSEEKDQLKLKSLKEQEKIAYDYGNLNASYVNEKTNLPDDYVQEIINPDFDKIDSPFQQTSYLKPYVPIVILEKIIIELEDEVVSLLDKEKEILKTIESLKSKDVEKGVESSEKVISETENKSENDCQVIKKVCNSKENPNVIAHAMFKLNLETLSSVRRPKPSGVMWMKKGSSNTVKADLSSRENLMACNNSDTRSAFDCNNARNALCNARMNASIDANDLFVFDDASIRKSHVSKIPFRKKPSASLNVPSRKCDKVENPKVIAPEMFKLSVSQSVSPISISKLSCDSKNVETKLKRKRHLYTFSSVRRPKNSGVI
nr:nucleolar protein 58-like [Tanacetum cinerariifolium]